MAAAMRAGLCLIVQSKVERGSRSLFVLQVEVQAWLPDGYSQIFNVFGPSGFWTMALLRYAAKFDPFLFLERKDRKGSNFEA